MTVPMTAETIQYAVAGVVTTLVLFEAARAGARLWRRRLRIAERRAIATWIRTTPFSQRVGLADEECLTMTRDQIDAFMRPEDMSSVRDELEQLEKAGEFRDLETATKARLALLAPAARVVVPTDRPSGDDLTDEEREVIERTDARRAR